jgi:hypothetical protein
MQLKNHLGIIIKALKLEKLFFSGDQMLDEYYFNFRCSAVLWMLKSFNQSKT